MENNLKLVFVSPIMENEKTDRYVYRFYYSEHPDVVWGSSWDCENPRIVFLSDPEDLYPQKESYCKTEDVESDYKSGLAISNSCYPLLYCIYGILALAWIDIEDLEKYPDQGRGVLKFGMDYDDVQETIKQYKKPLDFTEK